MSGKAFWNPLYPVAEQRDAKRRTGPATGTGGMWTGHHCSASRGDRDPFNSPTFIGCAKAFRYFYEIMRSRFRSPASPSAAMRACRQPAICPFVSTPVACLASSMNHAFRFVPAAALAGALFAMTARAWSQDIPNPDAAGTNVFRAERRATNGVRIPRDAHAGRYAAPATHGPFETNDTRELRMSGGRLVPRARDKRAGDSHWPANRVTPGADGLGRRMPEHERRALNWDAYLKDNGTPYGGGLSATRTYSPSNPRVRVPVRPYGRPHGLPGVPNPYDPSVPQPETRTFYDNGAGTRCTATGGAGVSRSSCDLGW
ncbi:hypothetical protein [Burkholderia stagnalis]|uniref:hypothetical protein n=1 Tax=Burkholderia stagnalis TaxID=1503054 RepID=UPI000ABD06A7